jgi:hypothetical protein
MESINRKLDKREKMTRKDWTLTLILILGLAQAISELRLALHESHFTVTREPPSTLASLRRRTTPKSQPMEKDI